jgi:predicted 3-demethylubiquinone-9 3-methyltransferase (glyoxalase superfamily)
MQKIMPCLWFDRNAEEAARFYVSVFKRSRIVSINHYGEAASAASGLPKGTALTVVFELEGQRFMGLNGGPIFTFSPAISLVVSCKTQRELDELWESLSADPASEQCGWLKDMYGVSWQLVPSTLERLISDKHPERADRVMAALVPMKKLDLKALEEAYGISPASSSRSKRPTSRRMARR